MVGREEEAEILPRTIATTVVGFWFLSLSRQQLMLLLSWISRQRPVYQREPYGIYIFIPLPLKIAS